MPLIVGDADLAMRICEAALEQGVFAQAIRPPTVPEGTSRLRLAVMASHTRAELRDAARDARPGGAAQRPAPVRRRVPVAAAQTTAPAALRRACSTATPRSACRGRRERPRRRRADARALRHRHRHGRRQDGRRRRDRRRAARARRAGRRLQAGRDRARRARRRRAGRATTSCSRPRRARAPEAVAPHAFGPAVSPHLAAELAGVELDLDAMVVAAERGGRRGAAPTCSSSRASAACSCR